MNSNLTSISYVAKVVDKNSTDKNSTDDLFLDDISPTQNTKSKLYTIKKSSNATLNGQVQTFKYKRNNTIERSNETKQLDYDNNFESIGCDQCTNSSDLN